MAEKQGLIERDQPIISVSEPLEMALMVSTGGAGAGARVLAGLGTKAAARSGLLTLGVEGAQAAAARSAIGRATTKTTIDLIKEKSGDVVVRLSRAGRDGHQVVESVISPNGTKSVVQKAYDAAGRLVHHDPK